MYAKARSVECFLTPIHLCYAWVIGITDAPIVNTRVANGDPDDGMDFQKLRLPPPWGVNL